MQRHYNQILMLQNSLAGGWYINDFHRRNSMAAQREVMQMSLHPCSREQKLAQIANLRQHSCRSDILSKTPELRNGIEKSLTTNILYQA